MALACKIVSCSMWAEVVATRPICTSNVLGYGLVMVRTPKSKGDAPEGDPKRGDELLKRMLQTKPKQHKDMIAERKAKRGSKKAARSQD
jgi:hypothetical protein